MTLRRVALGIAVLLLVVAGLGYTQWYRPTRHAVGIGAGMLAKQMCSCLFVAGRDEEACRMDQLSSMDPIQVEVRQDPRGVFAFVPLLGERLATYRDGLGCTLR